ncbi:hypothetical protein EV401DRAFT_2077879 [Pisolithus croceorrhizus]|nr:hypothetical protein EV401DRAFT_2077879 [Pisolithus croceorrhizus]
MTVALILRSQGDSGPQCSEAFFLMEPAQNEASLEHTHPPTLRGSLVGIAELAGSINKQASWEIGMNFIVGKHEPSKLVHDGQCTTSYCRIVYTNSLLALLNIQQHLRSLATSTASNSHFGAIHFANLPKLSRDVGGSADGGRRFDPQEMAVINITTEPTFDKITRVRREAETYVYYMHYSEDTSVIKLMVAAIWLFDTLHVSFMCYTLYYYLITNYGNLLSLEYIVWFVIPSKHTQISATYKALIPSDALIKVSLAANVRSIHLIILDDSILIVFHFFAYKIYHLCRRKVRWMVTAPITLSVLAHLGFGVVTVVTMLINNQASAVSQARFYSATPAVSAVVLAEILITTSLCVLLYDRGSRSAVPRTKRLLNTLIIYAVNRCLLTLLVTIAQLVVDANDQAAWTMGLDFIVGKLYANSLLASLNTRQHLRSQGSGPESSVHANTIHFANLPKPSEDERSSKDGERYFEARGGAILDITTVPVHDKIPALRGEEEV